MFLKLTLLLGFIAFVMSSNPSAYQDQHNPADNRIPDSTNGYPYYSGYPYYAGGYPYYHGAYPYYAGAYPAYYQYFAPVVRAPTEYHGATYVFHGRFDGHCGQDGLYFVDRRSFAFCHHGQRTVQSCAEGAANKDFSNYKSGTKYSMNEFCSVNLLANPETNEVAANTYA